MTQKTGWIGLGKMGAPMAANICKAGYNMSVYNRSPAKCEALRGIGAHVAKDLDEVVGRSDLLFVMVSDDGALRQVTLGEHGVLKRMRPGTTLVEMSTVSSAVSAELAVSAENSGVHYLRAPVSGSVTLATAGALTILASGPRDTFDATLPVFEAMSTRQFYVGMADEARVLKLSINMMVGFSAAMMGEALALGLKNGLDRGTMLDVIGASAIASPLLCYKLDALKARDYSPSFEVTQMAKDFDLILEAGHRSDIPLPLAALVREGWSALIANGDGEEDFFKYVELASRYAKIDDAFSSGGEK